MQTAEARELLESVHRFPGPYTFKVIGLSRSDFVERTLLAVRQGLGREEVVLEHSFRRTPSGRHTAITLLLRVESADEVLAIYRSLKRLEGLTMLM